MTSTHTLRRIRHPRVHGQAHRSWRGWELQDHWDGDLCAVGIASPGDAGRLAYVSCWGQPPGCYHVELEVGDSDEGYAITQQHEALTLTAAVALVIEHLSTTEA